MNIAEILKDYPKGTKLYSTVFGECYLENVSICLPYPIEVRIPNSGEDLYRTFDSEEEDLYETFNEEGKYTPTGECCLFPSKDNRDWSTFKVEPKFHKGDWVVVVTSEGEKVVQIDSIEYFKNGEPRYITSTGKWFGNFTEWFGNDTEAHLWTIQDAKDGDILNSIRVQATIVYKGKADDGKHIIAYCALQKGFFISQELPWDKDFEPASEYWKNELYGAMVKKGYKWDSEKLELVKIHQKHGLEPFEKVLVRDSEDEKWLASLFSHHEYESSFYKFCCIDGRWQQCIPYEGNEHLLGTSDNPKE